MKTFVVLSDSHGRRNALEKIKPLFAENDFIVTLTMEEVFSLDMHVVSRAQASLLEKNFRGNAEKMYQTILNALIQDGTESEDDAK